MSRRKSREAPPPTPRSVLLSGEGSNPVFLAACVSLGHDCCETVKVLLCASKEGLPVFVVAEEDFRFIQDEAYDAAQFLATSAGNQQALNFTRFLDRSGLPSTDVNSLDEKVSLAFRHLKLPAEWNVLGTDAASHGKNFSDSQSLNLEFLCFWMGLLLYGDCLHICHGG